MNAASVSSVQPFDVLTLRFESDTSRAPQVATLHVETVPSYPGVDWDHGRDGASTFANPTSFVAVITPGLKRLKVHVRFLELPAIQHWKVWASDPSRPRVLPKVTPQVIFERLPGCISPELLFQVDARSLAGSGVGRYEIEWHWHGQYCRPKTKQPSGPIRTLGVTRFVLFGILAPPTGAPWMQPPIADPDRDLPRVTALDFACRSAAGAKTLKDASGRIAGSVFDLGSDSRTRANRRRFVYDDRDDFACDREHHLFRWTSFLEALNGPAGTDPARVACEDLATVTCIFANALGADLERRRITLPGSGLPLPRVRLIGLPPSQPANWQNHIVAWSPSLEAVFDACLQFNTSKQLHVERWETPAGMPFGKAIESPRYPRDRGYRHRLLTRQPHKCQFNRLRNPTLDRRSAIPFAAGGIIEAERNQYLASLARFKAAAYLPDPLTFRSLSSPELFASAPEAFTDRGWRATATWVGLDDRAGQRLQMIGELAPDAGSARDVAAWRLTFYRQQMEPREDERFPGAIFCATDDEQHLLLVYANGVLRLRSEGAIQVAVPQLFAPVITPLTIIPT